MIQKKGCKIADKQERKKVSFWITDEQYQRLQNISIQNNNNISETLRELLDRQLNVTAAKEDIDFIRRQLREELSLQLKPNTDRIMKMLMRIGMMAVTFSFFTGKIIYYFVPFGERKSHDELMSEAKKNAAAYLSMRDETLDKAYKEFKDKN